MCDSLIAEVLLGLEKEALALKVKIGKKIKLINLHDGANEKRIDRQSSNDVIIIFLLLFSPAVCRFISIAVRYEHVWIKRIPDYDIF